MSAANYDELRLELADLLRACRRSAELTGDEVAERVRLNPDESASLSQSKLSKIENQRVTPSVRDVELILDATAAPEATRKRALTLAEDVNSSIASWDAIHRDGMAGHQREILEIERGATRIRLFQSAIIPGLLQSADYAREILVRVGRNRRDIVEAVAVRLECKQI